MYNRYLTASSGGGVHGYAPHYQQKTAHLPHDPPPEADCCEQTDGTTDYVNEQPKQGGIFGNLLGGLTTPKLDTDLLIAIGVVWFLLSDGEASDTDLLIIIGVLLLLGI